MCVCVCVCVCVCSVFLKKCLLNYSLFTMLCQFQVYSEVNQWHIHTHVSTLLRIFPHAGHCGVFGRVPCAICVSACSDIQSSPNLCDSVGYDPPVSSVHGIFLARILEWVAISSSGRSSQTRDQTRLTYVSCIDRWVLYHQCHLGSLCYRVDSYYCSYLFFM